jgi:hypothetical protein
MSTIRIVRTTNQIQIASPYSPDLPKRARTLSGKWDSTKHVWFFPLAAEPQVRDLYMDVYGTWDDMPADTVTLRCTYHDDQDLSYYKQHESLTLGGRVIATAYGRDSGARTADGVIVIEGKFGSGGSVKNWCTMVRSGTTFRVLDVPRPKAEALVANPEWCSKIEIEQPEAPPAIDRDALIAERTRLAARLAEIDALLHQE